MAFLAEESEVLYLIDTHGLTGRRIDWVDAHLLTSESLSGATLWTLDRSPYAVADELRLAFVRAEPLSEGS